MAQPARIFRFTRLAGLLLAGLAGVAHAAPRACRCSRHCAWSAPTTTRRRCNRCRPAPAKQ
ncbi:hypothetical protein NWF32_21635 [Pseudomonas qingdaonensis]|nr:hypothetical protein [Pseudomonas qingdaonensis]